jgi:segregation and condensation protein B
MLGKLMIKKEKISKDNVVTFPSKLTDLEKQIEAVIFAAAEPLDIDTIESKISKKTNVAKSLEKLQQEYSNRGINLVCIKDKWSFRTSPKLSVLMTQEKTVEKKLSRAAIETLAIIVYHQPVTRAEIEEIRGVAFGTNTLEILMELDWVKPGGRKDVPGKPIQYLTTDGFLNHFNLQKLSDLPTVDELGAAGLIDNSSVDNSIFGTSKFFKEKQDEKKEDIYSNIDEMLNSTLEEEEKD